MNTPNLGAEPEACAGRDAVHVAIIAMTALVRMIPGQKLKDGIVDPYRTEPVEAGQRYWLFLYPGSVTSLRHVWSHPAFPDEKP